MRVYMRLGRSLGVSMPWWLALPVLAFWLGGLVVVVTAVVLYAFGGMLIKTVQRARTPKPA
jgi:hypothetical protein